MYRPSYQKLKDITKSQNDMPSDTRKINIYDVYMSRPVINNNSLEAVYPSNPFKYSS